MGLERQRQRSRHGRDPAGLVDAGLHCAVRRPLASPHAPPGVLIVTCRSAASKASPGPRESSDRRSNLCICADGRTIVQGEAHPLSSGRHRVHRRPLALFGSRIAAADDHYAWDRRTPTRPGDRQGRPESWLSRGSVGSVLAQTDCIVTRSQGGLVEGQQLLAGHRHRPALAQLQRQLATAGTPGNLLASPRHARRRPPGTRRRPGGPAVDRPSGLARSDRGPGLRPGGDGEHRLSYGRKRWPPNSPGSTPWGRDNAAAAGTVSATELLEAAIARGWSRPADSTPSSPTCSTGAAPRPARLTVRCAAVVTNRWPEFPSLLRTLGVAGRRPRGDGGRGPLPHPCRRRDGLDRGALPGGRPGGVRQDQHPGMGQPLHHGTVAVRSGPSTRGPGRHAGRVQRRSAAATAPVSCPPRPGDGTGSIRVPASCCGLVGLKPRAGLHLVHPGGHLLEDSPSSTPLTRTVRDSAALLDAVTGCAPGDPLFAPLPPQPFPEAIRQPPALQRILVATGSPFPRPATDRAVVAAVEGHRQGLERLGHEIDIGAAAFDADAVADAIAVLQ